MWTVKHYVAGNGNSPFKEWYDQQDADVRAHLDKRVEYLVQQPRNLWSMPHIKQLHVPCDGLHEIRFKANRVQFRPLGFFGPGPLEFTFLVGAIEKGGRLEPRTACSTAKQYMTAIMQHGGRTDVWDT